MKTRTACAGIFFGALSGCIYGHTSPPSRHAPAPLAPPLADSIQVRCRAPTHGRIALDEVEGKRTLAMLKKAREWGCRTAAKCHATHQGLAGPAGGHHYTSVT
jgi:hypothetical protein